jgi:3-oxoacyl-[acyl-carrier protein] reductase
MVTSNPRARPDRIPLGGFGRADEAEEIAVVVLGDAYVTGQTIQVNGGVYHT